LWHLHSDSTQYFKGAMLVRAHTHTLTRILHADAPQLAIAAYHRITKLRMYTR